MMSKLAQNPWERFQDFEANLLVDIAEHRCRRFFILKSLKDHIILPFGAAEEDITALEAALVA